MDSYREHPSDFDLSSASETNAADDVAAAIGTDERRMHVRAYNHWVSLLEGRDFPSIEDLEPADVQDFSGHSVLLDFTCGRDNPAVPYVGGDIRDECGLGDDVRTIADVPSRSLLSRLTDHYMQIIANRAPVGFEAEFVNQRGENICYRGILMPFSSDGEVIDFIYGVINWKTVGEPAESALTPELKAFEPSAMNAEPAPLVAAIAEIVQPGHDEHLAWEDGPSAEPLEPVEAAVIEAEAAEAESAHFSWQEDPEADDPEALPELALGPDAALADRLWAARETAEAVKSGEGRTRAALYKALALAYDFALGAQDNPDDYADLLEESGVKAQARAPMTPIVKLVFGIDYDKTRLTEFAAALSYARRQELAAGGFQTFIEGQAGGLKALVAAERQARRPEPRPDTKGEAARSKLRSARAISLADFASGEEFGLAITRRLPDGGCEVVAVIDDPALVERAIRAA